MTMVNPRGPYRKGAARRLQILQAATIVFGRHGYGGGSLRRIAEQADLTEPGLLRHFGSKQNLLLATLTYWANRSGTGRSAASAPTRPDLGVATRGRRRRGDRPAASDRRGG